jgi:hypothetical protein
MLLAGLTLTGLALPACSASSGSNEYVVYFTADATAAQKEAVRDACPGAGNMRLEPRDHNNIASARTYPVRYDATKASGTDISQTTSCVARQPGVKGIGSVRSDD